LLRSINCEELCKIFYSSNKSITNLYEKYCVLTGGKYILNESDFSRRNDICILSNNVSCNAYEYYLGNCPVINHKENEPSKVFTITAGQISRITERKIYVIPISQELENVWREMFPNPEERPKIPEVDFSKYNVVAIYDGQRSCTGYSLVLESYEETSNEIKVRVKTMAPGKNCACASMITYPYILLGVSKSDKNISVTRNLEIYNC
ncbi:MAG: protease complex subunit PrcB family protein, partial [Candidatus Anstonellales archaeon]